jgi:hypothetical protein
LRPASDRQQGRPEQYKPADGQPESDYQRQPGDSITWQKGGDDSATGKSDWNGHNQIDKIMFTESECGQKREKQE